MVTGDTTADNIRVAGKLMDTSTAYLSLLVESNGEVSGDISYGDLEMRKAGNLIGNIKQADQENTISPHRPIWLEIEDRVNNA